MYMITKTYFVPKYTMQSCKFVESRPSSIQDIVLTRNGDGRKYRRTTDGRTDGLPKNMTPPTHKMGICITMQQRTIPIREDNVQCNAQVNDFIHAVCNVTTSISLFDKETRKFVSS